MKYHRLFTFWFVLESMFSVEPEMVWMIKSHFCVHILNSLRWEIINFAANLPFCLKVFMKRKTVKDRWSFQLTQSHRVHTWQKLLQLLWTIFFSFFLAEMQKENKGSSPAVDLSVSSAPLSTVKRLIPVTVQAVDPPRCLQLLLNDSSWVTEFDNKHPMGYNAFHTCHTSSTTPDFLVNVFPPPPSDWFPSTPSPFHISWSIICTTASLCKWRKAWWQFQFGRDPVST